MYLYNCNYAHFQMEQGKSDILCKGDDLYSDSKYGKSMVEAFPRRIENGRVPEDEDLFLL